MLQGKTEDGLLQLFLLSLKCLWGSLEKNSEYAVWAREEQQTLLVGIPRDKNMLVLTEDAGA